MTFSAVSGEFSKLDMLKYAHTNGYPWDEEICKEICEEAGEWGHFEILKYTYDNGCPWNEHMCTKAAGNGHLKIQKYTHANGCPWDESTCTKSARCGYIEIDEWAHSHGCPWEHRAWWIASQETIVTSFASHQDTTQKPFAVICLDIYVK